MAWGGVEDESKEEAEEVVVVEGVGQPTGQTFIGVLSVTVRARHQRLASHQLLIVCFLLIDTG